MPTPIYDALLTERLEAEEWTPADLRPGYDLDTEIDVSYVLARRPRLVQADPR